MHEIPLIASAGLICVLHPETRVGVSAERLSAPTNNSRPSTGESMGPALYRTPHPAKRRLLTGECAAVHYLPEFTYRPGNGALSPQGSSEYTPTAMNEQVVPELVATSR